MGTERAKREQTAVSMANMLHPLASRKKVLMILASNASEGGGQTGLQAWAVAGLLASQAEWERFEQNWKDVPAPQAIRQLRARQVENVSSPLADGELLGIGCAVSAAAFSSIPYEERKRVMWGNADNPLLYCFQHCIESAVRHTSNLSAAETVCFLMDCGDAVASTALWFYEDLKNLSPGPVRRRLGALGVEAKREFALLRAADALATECYERLQARAENQREATRLGSLHFQFAISDGARPLANPLESLQTLSPHGPRR